MKKSYLMMAAAATMLAACTQTDLVQEVNTQQAISFEAFAGKTTRTEIANLTKLQEVGFKVWGYAIPDDDTYDPLTPFSGATVTYNNGKWGYTGEKQEWKPGYEYTFGAIAPAAATNAAFDATTKKYSVTGAKSGIASSSNVVDYLVATPQTIHASNANLVTLDFGHIMSKVSVAVDGSADVKIHKIEVKGWNDSETNSYSTDGGWSFTGDPAYADYVTLRNAETDGEGKKIYESTENATDNANSLLIVPQDGAVLTFRFTYKVGATEFENKEVTVTAQDLAVNQHTTYSFTVGAAIIEFSAKMETGWSTADPQPTIPKIEN